MTSPGHGPAGVNWLALDIGGANLKVADGCGFARSHVFAMWQDHKRLVWKLRSVIGEAPPSDHLAVTMTGELADCFAGRSEGVRYIVEAVQEAADARHTRVYLVDGRLVTPQVAVHCWPLAASSNWHALARYCGRFARAGTALLIDVGSTTVDLIPLRDGRPVPHGATDLERLAAGELVYTGIERTPVCALVRTLRYHEHRCPVAQEVFATLRDVYLILGQLPEVEDDCGTADHRPATVAAAQRRLARMLCAEPEQFTGDEIRQWAREIADSQLQLLARRAAPFFQSADARPGAVILTGHGEFLARELLQRLQWSGTIISLREKLDAVVSRCAPAHALAVLARETVPV